MTKTVVVANPQSAAGSLGRRWSTVEAALRRAIASPTSYLIDVVTDPETRIKRAIKDVIPIITDRKPQQGADAHFAPPLAGSWPA